MSFNAADRIAQEDFGDAETVTTRQLRERLSEVLGRCAYAGDRFVIKRNGKAVAAIVPLEDMFVAQVVEDLRVARAANAAADEAGEQGWTSLEDVAKELGWE
jgi:antitoxin (DNA-binding transcriptional repressor) of toxin-antitoxin stability system